MNFVNRNIQYAVNDQFIICYTLLNSWKRIIIKVNLENIRSRKE